MVACGYVCTRLKKGQKRYKAEGEFGNVSMIVQGDDARCVWIANGVSTCIQEK